MVSANTAQAARRVQDGGLVGEIALLEITVDPLTGKKLTYDVEHGNTLIFLSPDGKLRYVTEAGADTQGSQPPPALVRFMDPQGRRNLDHPNPGDSWTVPQALQVLGWLNGREIPAGPS